MDDGVQEVRLVCRRWYELANKLPLNICLTRENQLQLMVEKFPRARSLSFYLIGPGRTDEDSEPVVYLDDALLQLTQLHNLETLDIYGFCENHCDWSLSDSAVNLFLKFRCLTSLRITLESQADGERCAAQVLPF